MALYISKHRDKSGNIVAYTIMLDNGSSKVIKADELKKMILKREIVVSNLKLTTDNKLIDLSSNSRKKNKAVFNMSNTEAFMDAIRKIVSPLNIEVKLGDFKQVPGKIEYVSRSSIKYLGYDSRITAFLTCGTEPWFFIALNIDGNYVMYKTSSYKDMKSVGRKFVDELKTKLRAGRYKSLQNFIDDCAEVKTGMQSYSKENILTTIIERAEIVGIPVQEVKTFLSFKMDAFERNYGGMLETQAKHFNAKYSPKIKANTRSLACYCIVLCGDNISRLSASISENGYIGNIWDKFINDYNTIF